jgi:hypothetical protein
MSKARDIVETLRTVLVDGDVTNANFTGADLEISKGGTGASSTGAARTALGVAIGTDVLAPDGDGSALTGVDSLPSQTSQSGKFLTTNGSAASWGTVAAGMTLLSTVTANASSTVTVSGLDATYDDYVIMISSLRTSAHTYIRCTWTVGGTLRDSDKYAYCANEAQTNTTNTVFASTDDSYCKLHQGPIDTTSNFGSLSLTMTIPSPARTDTYKSVYWHTIISNRDTPSVSNNGMCKWGNNSSGQTGALTAIKFYPSSGTITSGEFKLYGIRKS